MRFAHEVTWKVFVLFCLPACLADVGCLYEFEFVCACIFTFVGATYGAFGVI